MTNWRPNFIKDESVPIYLNSPLLFQKKMALIQVNWDTFAIEMTGNNVPINLNSSLLNMEKISSKIYT